MYFWKFTQRAHTADTLRTFANSPYLLSFRRRSESSGNVYTAWIPTYVGMTDTICESPNSILRLIFLSNFQTLSSFFSSSLIFSSFTFPSFFSPFVIFAASRGNSPIAQKLIFPYKIFRTFATRSVITLGGSVITFGKSNDRKNVRSLDLQLGTLLCDIGCAMILCLHHRSRCSLLVWFAFSCHFLEGNCYEYICISAPPLDGFRTQY